ATLRPHGRGERRDPHRAGAVQPDHLPAGRGPPRRDWLDRGGRSDRRPRARSRRPLRGRHWPVTENLTAVDCQGFAGGFTLGVVQAGFQLVGKREHPARFGAGACESNRHLLGDTWQLESGQEHEWSAVQGVDLVFGNPPCSGFSVASNSDFRGANSPINSCMWDFVNFAVRCEPRLAALESTPPALSREDGRDLMRRLRAHLEARTGGEWYLTHVKHNAYACGGAAYRPRYFWVASREPRYFDVTPLDVDLQPTLWDAIGDLSDLELTWEPQPYGN